MKKEWPIYFLIPVLIVFGFVLTQGASASEGVYVPAPATSFVANVRDAEYGAQGDGATDDTAAIQKAIDATAQAGGGVVEIPAGSYMIDTLYQTGNSYEKAGLVLKDNIIIHMADGAVLRAIPNGEKSYQMFSITHVNNAHILGGTLIGDRDSHIGNLGQTGYGIRITDATNVVIENLYAKEFWGDGVFLGRDSRNITIYKVVCDHNRRQGMSVVGGQNIRILDSEFTRSDGTAPKSGIDIEPEGDVPVVRNVEIRNCVFSGNGMGFVVGNHYINSVVENLTFADNTVSDNRSGINLVGLDGGQITGNTVYHDHSITENDDHCGIRLRNDGFNPTRNVTVSNNTVYGANIIDSTNGGGNTVENNIFKSSVYIRGIAHAGQTLTAQTYDGDYGELYKHKIVRVPAPSISYQWFADGTAIDGATQSAYVPTAADEGKVITVSVHFTDKAGNDETAVSSATLPVGYANHAPTDITLNPLFIYSNEYLAEVGRLSSADPDVGDMHTYTVDDDRFEVAYDNLLRLKKESYIEFGSVSTITLNVTTTDALGASFTKAFTIDVVQPKNQPPRKITLSNLTLEANMPGKTVGQLATVDFNVGDTHTYTVDDARFEIGAGGILKLKADKELDGSQNTITLNVTTKDSKGRLYTERFNIQVVPAGSGTAPATPSDAAGKGDAQSNSSGSVKKSNNSSSDLGSSSAKNSRRNRRSTSGSGGYGSSGSSSTQLVYIHTDGRSYNSGSWKKEGSVWKLDIGGDFARSAWGEISGSWYVFEVSGKMVTGWVNVDGKWYYMGGSGAMHTGWMKDGNRWYYLDGSGSMRIGWVYLDNKWYYMDGSGKMVAGWVLSNSKYYYMGSDGAMLVNTETPDGYRVDADGVYIK